MSSNEFLNILYFLAGICILVLIYIKVLEFGVYFFIYKVTEGKQKRFFKMLLAFSVVAFFLFDYACFKLFLFIF